MSISISENFALARLFIKKSGIRQFQWLGLVNIYLHAKSYQKIHKRFKGYTPYSVSENFASARLFLKKSGIRLSHFDLLIL